MFYRPGVFMYIVPLAKYTQATVVWNMS